MPVPNPFEQLGLTTEATPAEVRLKYLELAKIHHPDAGGDPAAFNALKGFYEQALAHAEKPKPCPTCKGSKVARVRNGFNVVTVMCPECRGSGLKTSVAESDPMNTEPKST